MTEWINIHPDFTSELQKEWETLGLTYEQVEEWIQVYSLSPKDADFVSYVGERGYTLDDDYIRDELDDLRNEYNSLGGKASIKEPFLKRKIEEVTNPDDKNWKNIKIDFTLELVKEWQKNGFDYEKVKDWINIGMKITDAGFCSWLRDEAKVDTQWVLNYGDDKQLRSKYQQYLTINQIVQQTIYRE